MFVDVWNHILITSSPQLYPWYILHFFLITTGRCLSKCRIALNRLCGCYDMCGSAWTGIPHVIPVFSLQHRLLKKRNLGQRLFFCSVHLFPGPESFLSCLAWLRLHSENVEVWKHTTWVTHSTGSVRRCDSAPERGGDIGSHSGREWDWTSATPARESHINHKKGGKVEWTQSQVTWRENSMYCNGGQLIMANKEREGSHTRRALMWGGEEPAFHNLLSSGLVRLLAPQKNKE